MILPTLSCSRCPGAAVADDALVLPQGVLRVSGEASFSFPVTERFTASSGTEALATDFNRDLDSTVFSDLRRVETAFRLPAGAATVGRSVVDFTRHIQSSTVRAATLARHGSLAAARFAMFRHARARVLRCHPGP